MKAKRFFPYKRLEMALLIGLVVCVIASLCSFTVQCEDISQRVLRLHILANSDSQEDQALKLKVRDRLLEIGADTLDQATDKEEALRIAKEQLPTFQQAAQKVIKENGYSYSVSVQLCTSWFDTRVYDTVTLPAGEYMALRVLIGEAKGHNWWCVMFPPMCVPAASPKTELSQVLTEEESEIVENGQRYEIRFWIVEWFESLKHRWCSQ